jgi:hypothetical protein
MSYTVDPDQNLQVTIDRATIYTRARQVRAGLFDPKFGYDSQNAAAQAALAALESHYWRREAPTHAGVSGTFNGHDVNLVMVSYPGG